MRRGMPAVLATDRCLARSDAGDMCARPGPPALAYRTTAHASPYAAGDPIARSAHRPGRHTDQVGTPARSAQSAIAPRFTSVCPLPKRIGPVEYAVDATSRLLYYGNRSVATLLEAVMGFPDRIERTGEVAHPPGKVLAALTTAEGLGAWFGDEATIDLRPGGAARMRWSSGFRVEMRVERVEEPTAGRSPADYPAGNREAPCPAG